MSRRNRKSGVTLLETLIALAIMAMAATLLSAAFSTYLKLLDRSETSSAEVESALGRRNLRVWIEHALPAAVPNDERPIFWGTSTELRFLSVPPGGQFWPGVATEILVGPTSEALAVGLSSERTSERTLEVNLSPQTASLRFEYWGGKPLGSTPTWHNEWIDQISPPELIRISFVGNQTLPPAILARPSKEWRQDEFSIETLMPLAPIARQ